MIIRKLTMIRIAQDFDDKTLRTALAGGPGHDRGRHRDRTRDDPHEIVYNFFKHWLYFVRVRLIGITSPATAPPARPAEAQGLPQC